RETPPAQSSRQERPQGASQTIPGRGRGAGRDAAQGIRSGGEETGQGGGQADHPPQHGRPQKIAAGSQTERQDGGEQRIRTNHRVTENTEKKRKKKKGFLRSNLSFVFSVTLWLVL